MKIRIGKLLLSAAMVCAPVFTVEIVIKDTTVEEKPKETPLPELPQPSSLSFNVINTTNFDYVILLWAKETNSSTRSIIAQNTVAANAHVTMAKFLSPQSGATYTLESHEVIVNYGEFVTQKLICEIKKPADTAEDETAQAKKSMDIFLYVPKDQLVPKCIIYFDTL